jgi:hypothetical protein
MRRRGIALSVTDAGPETRGDKSHRDRPTREFGLAPAIQDAESAAALSVARRRRRNHGNSGHMTCGLPDGALRRAELIGSVAADEAAFQVLRLDGRGVEEAGIQDPHSDLRGISVN